MWKYVTHTLLFVAVGLFAGCGGVDGELDTASSALIDFNADKPPMAIPARPGAEPIDWNFDFDAPPVAMPATPRCGTPTGLFAMKMTGNLVRLGWNDACGAGPVVYHVQSREAVIPQEPPVYRNHFVCGNLGARPRVLVENEPRALVGPYRVRTCPVIYVAASCKGVTVTESVCSPFSEEVRTVPCSGKGCLPVGER
ncbi:MAG: hypothetical protein HY791_22170 [Deltaproteobacteria bacterium]|nr:hypothetical protein [Deltaproteobacteria bacterium]